MKNNQDWLKHYVVEGNSFLDCIVVSPLSAGLMTCDFKYIGNVRISQSLYLRWVWQMFIQVQKYYWIQICLDLLNGYKTGLNYHWKQDLVSPLWAGVLICGFSFKEKKKKDATISGQSDMQCLGVWKRVSILELRQIINFDHYIVMLTILKVQIL